MKKEPTYIGDGIYVQWDIDNNLILTTGTHEIASANSTIYFGSRELLALLAYLDK